MRGAEETWLGDCSQSGLSSKFEASLEHTVRSWLKNQIKLKDKQVKSWLALPEETEVLPYNLMMQVFEGVIENKFVIVVWNITSFFL